MAGQSSPRSRTWFSGLLFRRLNTATFSSCVTYRLEPSIALRVKEQRGGPFNYLW
jgi:hypothetical protein